MATILVVDDEASARELLQKILGHAGYHVLEASDGMEALGVARGERPDLVIVDLMLPTPDQPGGVDQYHAARAGSTYLGHCGAS